jgi:hypothetical protein
MALTASMIANAEADLETLSDIINGSSAAPDVINRAGNHLKTIARVLAEATANLGYELPLPYAAGIAISRTSQTVEQAGTVWAPLPSSIPMITGAVFDATKWHVVQFKFSVATRDDVAALPAIAGSTVILSEGRRGGTFFFYTAAAYLALTGKSLVALVTADTERGVYIAPGTDLTGASGAWVRQIITYWKTEWFGAPGDGIANDHTAFRIITKLAIILGYLHVQLRGPDAIYRVGNQIANAVDVEGTGPYYRANENALDAFNLKSVIIIGNDATLKYNDGLLYGAFDPATGLAHDDAVSTPSHNAHPGFLVCAKGNDSVYIENVHVDGNSVNMVLGGTNGGFFEQRHTGFTIDSYLKFSMRGCTFKNLYQDGYNLRHKKWIIDATADEHPAFIENCVSQDCGRTCAATLGGNLVQYKNCAFLRPGNCPAPGGGVRSTGPATAHDVESEGSITANIHFEGCVFEQGPGQGTRAFSAGAIPYNIQFDRCKLVGAVLFDALRIRFRNCRLYGYFWRMVGNEPLAQDNMLFENCYFTDGTEGDTPQQVASGNLWCGTSSPNAAGIRYVNCEWDMSKMNLNLQDVITRDCKATLRQNTSTIADNAGIMSLAGSGDHEGFNIIEAITANFPSQAFLINTATTAKYRRCNLTSATPYVRFTTFQATLGFTGELDNFTGRRGNDVLTNANVTLALPKMQNTQVCDVPLTAARDWKLPAPAAGVTRTVDFVRTVNSINANNGNVKTNAGVLIKALTGPSTWCRVKSDNGAEYIQIGGGTL